MRSYFAAVSLLLLICVISLYCFFSMWNNTLYHNGNWESSKVKLGKGVIGSVAFMVTHRALAGGKLDLSTWLGFQEVFYKDPVSYDEMEIDVEPRKSAYIYVFLERKEDTLTGIRLSEKAGYPSMLFRSVNGRFIEKTPMPFFRGSKLRIDFREGLKIYANGGLFFFRAYSLYPNILGFRGSGEYENTFLIDNIRVNKNGKTVFKESFSKFSPIVILITILIWIFLNLLLYSLKKYKRFSLLFVFCIALLSLTIFIFYKYFGQYSYPPEKLINWHGYKSNIEFENDVRQRLAYNYIQLKRDTSFKIMFLGSSQTWGAGASSEQHTFISHFEALSAAENSKKIKCINAGVSAVRSDELVRLYKSEWIKFSPDILIVNLSNNDRGNDKFGDNLKELVRINRQKNIRTVFVLEPNVEPGFMRINKAHDVMRAVAASEEILLVDMQQYLSDRYDSGFLFWDNVHLTDYAQSLFAEKLFDELKRFM